MATKKQLATLRKGRAALAAKRKRTYAMLHTTRLSRKSNRRKKRKPQIPSHCYVEGVIYKK